MSLVTLCISLAFLVWSANLLVRSASTLASFYGVSQLLIGLTLVALGTSAPEIIVAISAAIKKHNALAIGNAIGSNIANIGLVLGLIICIKPPQISVSTLKVEYTILGLVMILTTLLLSDGYLGIIDGCLLLISCIGIVTFLALKTRYATGNLVTNEIKVASTSKSTMEITKCYLLFAVGLFILPLSSHFVVNSAVEIAEWMGVNQALVGLSVLAIGTSLPEVATSITAAVLGENELAMGNILGSNIFNLVSVLAFPGLINPAPITPQILTRDIPVMFGFTLLVFLVSYLSRKSIPRWFGFFFLGSYFFYIVILATH